MLIKLLPEQVEQAWEQIAPMIGQSLPPGTEKTRRALTNILISILEERGTCWALYTEDELHAILVTYQQRDRLTRGKFLVIYSAYSIKNVTRDAWNQTIGTLKKYAGEQNCRSVVFYTTDEKFARLAEIQGIDNHFHMITMEV